MGEAADDRGSTIVTIAGWRYSGTGVRIFGLEREPPDCIIFTEWLTLLFVPLIPLRRSKCRYLADRHSSTPEFGELRFEIVERLPISVSSVVATYIWSIVYIVLASGPLALLVLRTANRDPTNIEMVAALFLLVIVSFVPVVAVWRQWTRLDASRSTEDQTNEKQETAERAKIDSKEWKSEHVLPGTTYSVAIAVACIAGLALAEWLGWGGRVARLVAIAIIALTIGVFAGIDRMLVKRRTRIADDAVRSWSDDQSRG